MTATVPKPDAHSALLLRVDDVAELLDISPRQVWRMADAGSFPRPIRIGAKLKRWPRSAVENWLAEQTAAANRRR